MSECVTLDPQGRERNRRMDVTTNKHRIAWHEAGHAVVGRHLGMPLTMVSIWQTKYTRPNGSTFKMWVGEARGDYGSLSTHDQRVTSVAGAVAVYCWYEETSEKPDFEILIDWMSPADWTIDDVEHDPDTMSEAEEALWYKAMWQAYALLNRTNGPLWRELKREANKVIRKRFVSTLNIRAAA